DDERTHCDRSADMTPRVLIHHRLGSFSERWMAYCDGRGIAYRVVDCLDTDIVTEIASADALLCHWHHLNPNEQLIARQIIMAAQVMGVVVFPSAATCWHFDDKLGQKYLLEAVGAPLVPTRVFYEPDRALEWIATARFPKVFKLRRG